MRNTFHLGKRIRRTVGLLIVTLAATAVDRVAANDAIGFVPQYTLTSYQLATEKVRRYLDR